MGAAERMNLPMSDKIFVPDGTETAAAMARTSDLCIAAHQDDVEIMAFAPTAACYAKTDRWFSAVVLTNGAGSPRTGDYADYTDEQMQAVRRVEQNNAAVIGQYGFMGQLGYSSAAVKNAADKAPVQELTEILRAARPETVYTHNLADKHDTHVATALRTIEALRLLSPEERPKKVYSLEVWRGLDWLCDEDKTCFSTADRPHLAAALLGVFDSQIAGGKRYDSAAIGRRLANATFFASHNTDDTDSLSYGLDITDMVFSDADPKEFIVHFINRFQNEVIKRLEALS